MIRPRKVKSAQTYLVFLVNRSKAAHYSLGQAREPAHDMFWMFDQFHYISYIFRFCVKNGSLSAKRTRTKLIIFFFCLDQKNEVH